MDTVIVQLPEETVARHRGIHRKPRLIHMGPGETKDFGRGAPGESPAIVLTDPGVSRHAGRIEAAGDFWRLSNFSATSTYVVENLEGAGEYIRVAPGRLGAPVPFELSRVVLPALDGNATFKVFAPQHAYAPDGAGPTTGSGPSVLSRSTRRRSTSWSWSRCASRGCAVPPVRPCPAPGRSSIGCVPWSRAVT
ncbi:hypothetical protein SALBM311S_02429 [Streptomyces alboniger]